jgi:hypothetical protein
MRKAIYGIAGLTTMVLVLLGTYRCVFAQVESDEGNPPTSVRSSRSASPLSLAPNEVLQQNYLVHGTLSGTSFPAGQYTAVDSPQMVQCPGKSGTCTIAANIWVQTGDRFSTSNNYAVCLYVDGVSVDSSNISNGCHYTENTPSDGTFVEGSELNQLSGVSIGSHTVQTFLYTNDGTAVYNFNISYQVYKP